MGKLYTQSQRSDEAVDRFILQKRLFFARLYPERSEVELVRLTLTFLTAGIRGRIRGIKFDNMEDLERICGEIEADLREEKQEFRTQREAVTRQ